MSRVLVIGSSHVGALIRARDEIKTEYPQVDLDFFALPGGKFHQCHRLAGTKFGIGPEADRAIAVTAKKINGRTAVDLGEYDQIWVFGYRFRIGTLLQLLARNDVLEEGTSANTNACSQDFVDQTAIALVGAFGASLDQVLGTDVPLVISPAAAPSADLLKREKGFDPILAKAHTNPAFPAAFALFHGAIESWATDRGHQVVHQPKVTMAGTYTTLACFAQDARNIANMDDVVTDGRHMNAEYGLLLFEKFATEILGL